MDRHKPQDCSKPVLSLAEGRRTISPAQTQGRQDALFHGQGRRGFGARSVRGVREGERCEERQVCEREADKGPRTPLADFFNRPK